MPAIAIKDNGEFAEEILKDLIEQGYNGQELLQKFHEMQSQIKPAVESLLEEASGIAKGIAPYETYEDVFRKE